MHLEINTEIEDVNESGALFYYKQWLAVEVVSSAALSEEKAIRAAMRAPDWFLVKYECDGMEEWLRLKDFNCNSKGSWRLDLDYLDSGGASSYSSSSSSSSSSGPSGTQEESESSERSSSEQGSESEFEEDEGEDLDE
jgi:hypothetical protein